MASGDISGKNITFVISKNNWCYNGTIWILTLVVAKDVYKDITKDIAAIIYCK